MCVYNDPRPKDAWNSSIKLPHNDLASCNRWSFPPSIRLTSSFDFGEEGRERNIPTKCEVATRKSYFSIACNNPSDFQVHRTEPDTKQQQQTSAPGALFAICIYVHASCLHIGLTIWFIIWRYEALWIHTRATLVDSYYWRVITCREVTQHSGGQVIGKCVEGICGTNWVMHRCGLDTTRKEWTRGAYMSCRQLSRFARGSLIGLFVLLWVGQIAEMQKLTMSNKVNKL